MLAYETDDVELSIDRFDKTRTEPSPKSKFLTEDIAEDSGAISVSRVGEKNLGGKLVVSDLAKVGNLIVVFGEVGGQISIRNDVLAEPPS